MMRITPANSTKSITPLLMLTILAVFSFLFKDFHLPVFTSYAAFFIPAVLFIGTHSWRLYLSRTQAAAMILAFVTTIMVFMPNARTCISTISIAMALDIAMLYIMIAYPDKEDVERTMKILLIAAVIGSIYAIVISVYPDFYYGFVKHLIPSDTQDYIELGFRYNYGVALGGEIITIDYFAFFGVSIALNTLLIAKTKGKKRYAAIFIVCMFAIIVQNRKAELLTALIVVAILFLSNVNVTGMRQRINQFLVFFGVAVVGLIIFMLLLRNGYLSRYESFFTQMTLKFSGGNSAVDISSGRLKLWKRAIELFSEHPIFGIGWGSFHNYLTDTYNAFNDGQLSNAHNNYLQLICETGIVGFVVFAGLLMYIFYRTCRTAKRIRTEMPENCSARISVSTSLSFQTFYLLISFIDPVWYKMFTWPFYGVAIIMMIYGERCLEALNRLQEHDSLNEKEEQCLGLNA